MITQDNQQVITSAPVPAAMLISSTPSRASPSLLQSGDMPTWIAAGRRVPYRCWNWPGPTRLFAAQHTKREMVCTGLPEAMPINSTTLTMTRMALCRTALWGTWALVSAMAPQRWFGARMFGERWSGKLLGEQKQQLSDQGVSTVLQKSNVPSTWLPRLPNILQVLYELPRLILSQKTERVPAVCANRREYSQDS